MVTSKYEYEYWWSSGSRGFATSRDNVHGLFSGLPLCTYLVELLVSVSALTLMP